MHVCGPAGGRRLLELNLHGACHGPLRPPIGTMTTLGNARCPSLKDEALSAELQSPHDLAEAYSGHKGTGVRGQQDGGAPALQDHLRRQDSSHVVQVTPSSRERHRLDAKFRSLTGSERTGPSRTSSSALAWRMGGLASIETPRAGERLVSLGGGVGAGSHDRRGVTDLDSYHRRYFEDRRHSGPVFRCSPDGHPIHEDERDGCAGGGRGRRLCRDNMMSRAPRIRLE